MDKNNLSVYHIKQIINGVRNDLNKLNDKLDKIEVFLNLLEGEIVPTYSDEVKIFLDDDLQKFVYPRINKYKYNPTPEIIDKIAEGRYKSPWDYVFVLADARCKIIFDESKIKIKPLDWLNYMKNKVKEDGKEV
jgi:hypothetical protein